MRRYLVFARVVSRALSRCLAATYVMSGIRPPRTENPRVGGSTPSLATLQDNNSGRQCAAGRATLVREYVRESTAIAALCVFAADIGARVGRLWGHSRAVNSHRHRDGYDRTQ